MKAFTVAAITLTSAVTSANAIPDGYVPWQCHSNCGKALTEFNKCKGQGNYHECLCAGTSKFNSFLSPCLGCGKTIWDKYGKALARPMAECSIRTPFAVPDSDYEGTVSSYKLNEAGSNKDEVEKKAEEAEQAAEDQKKEDDGEDDTAKEAQEEAERSKKEQEEEIEKVDKARQEKIKKETEKKEKEDEEDEKDDDN